MKPTRIARQSPGNRMREAVAARSIMPFIGVYDVFSASLAGRQFDSLFLSGFGFAASHYGLPDVGFITWSEMVYYVQRIRTVLPDHHILVDIDDGYCDVEVACHVVSILETSGASGVVLEDQERPRRCGHFDGKRIMALDDYLEKLNRVLETRRDLFVVARTDSSDMADIERRVLAFAEAGADAVLVDGLKSLEAASQLTRKIQQPFCFNQIAGGKSPACTLTELGQAGIKLVIYSTPCLFAAQPAIENALKAIQQADGSLADSPIGVKDCNEVLQENLARRTSPQIIVRPSERKQ
ncbi:MAG TPA: isocitrate lyase/PEP mutase family protein [Steroidobacteraceae bacterium]|nr:isocitrate lyase/PEP mutase family protein [Steroidobacteraceae bacterium]